MKKSPEELINKAAFFQLSNNPEMALKYFYKSLKITERYPQVYSKIYLQNMMLCKWKTAKKFKILADKYFKYDSPFSNIIRVDNPKKNFEVAKNARVSARI